jgi:hypothetical protein
MYSCDHRGIDQPRLLKQPLAVLVRILDRILDLR